MLCTLVLPEMAHVPPQQDHRWVELIDAELHYIEYPHRAAVLNWEYRHRQNRSMAPTISAQGRA
jgi:hypothetical protein